MRSKKILLNGTRLYLILDKQVNSYQQLLEITKRAIPAGVDIIQLRDKNGSAKDILNFSRAFLKITKNRIPFIMNDRIDLAMATHASGVHLGQEDVPLNEARKMLGFKALIGVSCQTLAHAQKAQRDGADYIGFGSVFKTLTKPDRCPMDLKRLKTVAENIQIPIFAIGGIELKNVEQLRIVGVHRIAICRAICRARNIERVVQRFKLSLK